MTGAEEYSSIRLYLDDCRPAPSGWVLARSVDEAVHVLRTVPVSVVSLDYDLGLGSAETGITLLNWVEREVAAGRLALPELQAHSGSMLGQARLKARIGELFERFGPP